MAKRKSVTFRSSAEGPITVHIPATGGSIRFEPGAVRSYETSDPREIEALRANSDVAEAKGK